MGKFVFKLTKKSCDAQTIFEPLTWVNVLALDLKNWNFKLKNSNYPEAKCFDLRVGH